MDGKRRALHVIITLGWHIWSDYVRRGIPSLPLDRAHCVSAWHIIIAFGMHILSDDVGRDNGLIALGQLTRSNYVGHGIFSSPLVSTHG